jgi:hypothetical protein
MRLRKYKDELVELYALTGGIVAETARIFCKRHGIDYTDTYRRRVSKILAKEGVTRPPVAEETTGQDWEEDISKGQALLKQVVDHKIKTLEELVKTCQIDLEVWEIERYVCNAWGVTAFKNNPNGTSRTNYQIKAWLKRREVTFEEGIRNVLKELDGYKAPKLPLKVVKNDKHIVATMADFHIGADIKDLVRTPDFNINVLLDYIHYCVDKINSYGAAKVTLNLLGDFYESISGMNHENTFKSLGPNMWGGSVIILANKIMAEHLIARIVNLEEVNMISGNHDRMTASNKLDNTGEGAKVLWHMLKKDFPDLTINYSNSVMTREIDGINYILTHGDKGLSKREISKVVFDYGDPNLFNLLMEGHLHSRRTVKALTQKAKFYEEVEAVSLDEANYRKINVASLFTGNYYSESLGFAGTAGMTISFNNGISNRPEVHDITI